MFSELVTWYLFLGGAGAALAALLALSDLVYGCRTRLAALRGGSRTPSTHRPRVPCEPEPAFGGGCRTRLAALRGGSRTPSTHLGVLAWTDGLSRKLFARGYAAAGIALLLGVLCLLVDLGRPERFYYVFLRPTASILTFGSFVLGATLCCAVALGTVALGNLSRVPRPLVRAVEVLCVVCGTATAVYTGALLAAMAQANPTWNAALPFLFAFSSFSVGCAGALACLLPFENAPAAVVRAFAHIDLACIGLEALALLTYLALACVDAGSVSRAALLLWGEGRWSGWAVFAVCALGVPPILEVFSLHHDQSLPLAWSLVFVAVGGFFLRACVVGAPAVWGVG